MNSSYFLPPGMILAKQRAGDLSGLCCAIPDRAMPRSAGRHSRLAPARRRPRYDRRDLTPALVSWMLASAYPEESLYDETNTERHIFRRVAVVSQRLH